MKGLATNFLLSSQSLTALPLVKGMAFNFLLSSRFAPGEGIAISSPNGATHVSLGQGPRSLIIPYSQALKGRPN